MDKAGVVYGRFQIPHLKHIEYILAAKMRCQKLYIGITFPDDLYVSDEEGPNYRVKRNANPLTYIERYEMIRDSLLEFKVPREAFEIIPFPIDRPNYLAQYVPKDAVCYVGICDEWTAKNERMFQHFGIKTEVLWRREAQDKGVTGSIIRQKIQNKEDWRLLVPKAVYKYMIENEYGKIVNMSSVYIEYFNDLMN